MIRLALIGAGRWGQSIERTLREMPGIKLVVVDHAADTKKIVLADIDGALIATPGSTHVEVALPFIQAGLPVFIEKPLATSLAEARQLKQAAKNKNLVQVGHIHLYNPAFLAAKKAAQKIGQIRLIVFEGLAPGPVREDMSVWWDWGPHGVSMMMDLLKQLPYCAQAWGINFNKAKFGLYDVVQARLRFPDGAEALCSTSWLSPDKRTRLTVIGEKGSVVFDDRAEKKVIYFQSNNNISYPSYSNEPALRAELKQFLKMIKTKQPVLTGINNGLAVVEILDAVERSLRASGKIIQLK